MESSRISKWFSCGNPFRAKCARPLSIFNEGRRRAAPYFLLGFSWKEQAQLSPAGAFPSWIPNECMLLRRGQP
jgi:hypothetical protein